MLKKTALLLLTLAFLVPLAHAEGDMQVGSTPMNVTVQFIGVILEVTPEKLVLAVGETSTFDVYIGKVDGTEVGVNDAKIAGDMYKPDGTKDLLNFTRIGDGKYRSDRYTFEVVGDHELVIRIYSDTVGNLKSNVTISVSEGGIRALFPIGFNITAYPTLNFSIYPREFVVFMKDKRVPINLTIENKEDFNIIVLANSFLKPTTKVHRVVIPPHSNKTLGWLVEENIPCIEKRWVISLYVRGGLEVRAPINRVDVPVIAYTVCPTGEYPPEFRERIELLEAEREEAEKLKETYWTYAVVFGIALFISFIVIWRKKRKIKKLLKKIRKIRSHFSS